MRNYYHSGSDIMNYLQVNFNEYGDKTGQQKSDNNKQNIPPQKMRAQQELVDPIEINEAFRNYYKKTL